MAISPTENAEGPLGVTIKLDGTMLGDRVEVISVRVETDLNRIPTAVVSLADGDVASQSFPLTDSDDVRPGREIEILAHYGANPAQTVFRGIVTATRLRVRGGRAPQLDLTCRDKAIGLTDIPRTATWRNMADADAMGAILSGAGLAADVAATDAVLSEIVQYDTPDWEFLRLLAERNGLVLAVEGGKVTAREPDPSVPASLTVTLGKDLLEFDATVDAAGLAKTAEMSGWDPARQEVLTERRDAATAGSWGNSRLSDLTDVTGNRTRGAAVPYAAGMQSLSGMARARAGRVALAAMQGYCSFQGSALARPGDTLEIAGVGDRMGGTALVSGITHDIADGQWTTTARLGLPQGGSGDGPPLPGHAAAAVGTPVKGLHVGTVLAIVDPDGDNGLADPAMIKVRLPLMGDPGAEIWARFAQPYATGSAGIQFLPEIGDEVVVGFLSADPGAPVILGALHGGAIARARGATDTNGVKGLTTRSGLALTFDDNKRILTAETPDGHKLTMDDDRQAVTVTDGTGNLIEMTSVGIRIASTGTLDLTAAGAVTIASSGGDVTVSGSTATLRGDASAELSASGTTTVKGAMVMIN